MSWEGFQPAGGSGGGKSKIAFGKITLSAPGSSKKPEGEEDDGGGGFGSFGAMEQAQKVTGTPFKPPTATSTPMVEKTEEELEMERTMGFSGFGTVRQLPQKVAKTFDVKEMVEAIKKANKRRTSDPDTPTTDAVIQPLEQEEDRQRVNKKDAKVKEQEVVVVQKPASEDDEDDDDVVGPMPPPPTAVAAPSKGKKPTAAADSDDSSFDESDDDDDDIGEVEGGDEDEDSDTEAQKSFPLEHEVDIEHGIRPVMALAVDPTATRFATGSLDYEVKLWDFTALRNKHALRTVKPCENHPIKHVSFSANGEYVLVVSGSAQAKVLNRDGSELLECVKGDQYIVDMARTLGHTSMLNGGMFNPKNKSEFMTASDDSTVRLWEIENSRRHKTLVKLKSAGGLKTRVTACTYSRDGVCFLGGGSDGTICMWDTRRALVLPTTTVKGAHSPKTDIFHLTYSNSGLEVASRGEDAVVNIFDVRNWRKPLFKSTPGEFPAKYFTTDLCFSPDDRHLCIPTLPEGTSARTKDALVTHSSLKFFSKKSLSVVKEHNFPNEVVIRSVWHHRINQVLVSFASGRVGILYDTAKSIRGALLAHGKGPKRQKAMGVVEDMSGKVVITPNSLPLYKTERSKNPKREEAKLRADPVKSHRPDLPITAGSGGRVAASGSTLSSYVIRNLGLSKSFKDDMDPREAILRYAKDAEENPIWVTPAYKKTQPKAIFEAPKEEEPPDAKKQRLL